MQLSHELKVEASIEALIRRINSENRVITSCEFGTEDERIRVLERDGSWELCYVGMTYSKYKKDIVLEVFDRETKDGEFKSSMLYLTQYQEKTVYDSGGDVEYEVGNVQRVKPIKGKIINNKWVIKE